MSHSANKNPSRYGLYSMFNKRQATKSDLAERKQVPSLLQSIQESRKATKSTDTVIEEAFIRPPDPYGTVYSDNYHGKVKVDLTPFNLTVSDGYQWLVTNLKTPLANLDIDSIGTGDGYKNALVCSYKTDSRALARAIEKTLKATTGIEPSTIAVMTKTMKVL